MRTEPNLDAWPNSTGEYTIRTFFTACLGEAPVLFEGDEFCWDDNVDTIVGLGCCRIIDRAREFMRVCDPHPDIRSHIVRAAQEACSIILFG